MPASNGITHKDYVLDRAKRIDKLIEAVEHDDALRAKFFEQPASVGDKFGVSFSHEETFGITNMKGIKLADLRERLVLNAAMIFDGNCGCALFGPNGVLNRAIRPGL
jgi:hypothetical protein